MKFPKFHCFAKVSLMYSMIWAQSRKCYHPFVYASLKQKERRESLALRYDKYI